MAIEIRQLVIRAVVDDGGRSSTSSGPASLSESRGGTGQPQLGPTPSATTPDSSLELSEQDRQVIVNACVREVLRKLERARER